MFTPEIIAVLPPVAKRRLQLLDDLIADSHSRFRGHWERADRIGKEHFRLMSLICDFRTKHGYATVARAGARAISSGYRPDDNALWGNRDYQELNEAAQREQDEFEKFEARYKAAGDQHQDLLTLRTTLLDYLTRAKSQGNSFAAFAGDHQLTDDEMGNPVAAIAAKRGRREELLAELEEVKARPPAVAEIQNLAMAELERLAKRGEPTVVLTGPEAGKLLFGAPQVHTVRNGLTSDELKLPDSAAILSWFLFDPLSDRIVKLIEENADPNGISEAQRTYEIAAIDDEMLMIERQECQLLEHAADDGITVAPRPDTNPIAFLSLAAEQPMEAAA